MRCPFSFSNVARTTTSKRASLARRLKGTLAAKFMISPVGLSVFKSKASRMSTSSGDSTHSAGPVSKWS